ncbi:hypothetical protein CI109_104553 [Kwoniella shandongensis]|uniref:ABC1 atypical kinase-like domain-containing protein n=1 Tax=Kwoniella shandongensis TaxID=1734106 RepID=A0A5M6BTS8_9TREE|nr:uncharacterized protein CI109_005557 [Kwoniella shandongensis]KAA5526123.1 hypothetical protein CI109_005557 [Kwoniella shandongensis]
MLSAAIRVLARSATIQLEEVAALSASASARQPSSSTPTSAKGKGKEIDLQSEPRIVESTPQPIIPHEPTPVAPPLPTPSSTRSFPQRETLSDRLDKVNDVSTPSNTSSETQTQKKLSALDRMIQASPRQNPPPAPPTHPANQGRGELHQKPSSIFAPAAKQAKQAKASSSSSPKKDAKLPFITFSEPAKSGTNVQPKSVAPTASSSQAMRPSPAAAATNEKPLPSTTVAAPSATLSTSTKEQPLTAASQEEPLPSVKPSKETTPVVKAKQAPLPTSSTSQPAISMEEPISSATSAQSGPVQPEMALGDKLEGVSSLGPADSDPVALNVEDEESPVILRASKVPSSRLGRLFHYGSLAASMSFGAASESIRRSTGGTKSEGSVFMSDANVRRLVSTLGRMRGAALKLGQFMSIQDNHMLPPEIEKVLQQVQAHANYMPDWQMERVMREEFGSDWQSLFSSFDRTPVASASIGQVHRAILASDSTPVAVKIQFPGVASSIESDLSNLSLLLRSSALLPKGLYLQNTIAVMRRELEDECDYVREAASGKKFEDFLKGDEFFVVPKIIEEGTTGRVLTTEWMDGKPLSRVKNLSQETRDKIGYNVLRLCLQELFQFRFMQTDPNWGNFLYTSSPDKIQLIDFGASREYTKEFMDGWYRLLKSALIGDREAMRVESLNLGYLTGEEEPVMLEAHLDSMALVASPFSHDGPYPFAKQTITDSIRALIPVMLKHRLTPPPPETYSLNRKLSGAFLMCAKLGANVDCKQLWEQEVGNYKEG